MCRFLILLLDVLNRFFFGPTAGIFPEEHPAEDPVSAVSEESAVQHHPGEPQSLPVLQAQEMHRCRHVPRRSVFFEKNCVQHK